MVQFARLIGIFQLVSLGFALGCPDGAKAAQDEPYADQLSKLSTEDLIYSGRYDFVWPRFSDALTSAIDSHGADSAEAAQRMIDLAWVDSCLRRFEDADGGYTKATSILARTLGDRHPDVGRALLRRSEMLARKAEEKWDNLGIPVSFNTQLLKEAHEEVVRSLAVLERATPENPKYLIEALVKHGAMLTLFKQYDEAIDALERAIGLQKSSEVSGQLYYKHLRHALWFTLRSARRHSEADKIFIELLEIRGNWQPDPVHGNCWPKIEAENIPEIVIRTKTKISVRLAQADQARGARVFRKCLACHPRKEGQRHTIGPNLWETVNRAQGQIAGYKFSKALRELGGIWSFENLDAFLSKPASVAPGNKMTFSGIRNEQDRADLILYLRSLAREPAPLP